MEVSTQGLELIKIFEGFRCRAYRDGAGHRTIGFGHRLLPGEEFPDGLDEAGAEKLLLADLNTAVQAVERMVRVPLQQGQFDALVDFTYNLGAERLARSTLLRALNGGRYQAAGEQLLRWDLIAGQESEGLRRRRLAELALWSASATQPAAASATPQTTPCDPAVQPTAPGPARCGGSSLSREAAA